MYFDTSRAPRSRCNIRITHWSASSNSFLKLRSSRSNGCWLLGGTLLSYHQFYVDVVGLRPQRNYHELSLPKAPSLIALIVSRMFAAFPDTRSNRARSPSCKPSQFRPCERLH